MKSKQTWCSDWHKGWGYGGHNKIGKLNIEISNPIKFTWKGHSQGRHGQVSNRGARVEFTLIGGELRITNQKGSYPDYDQVTDACNRLLRMNGLPELPDKITITYEKQHTEN